MGAPEHKWLLEDPLWAQKASPSSPHCMQLLGLPKAVASQLTPLLATKPQILPEGRAQGTSHTPLMAAAWIMNLLWSICPNCAWNDHSKTHISPVKSPDDSHPLRDKGQVPELTLKVSILPPDFFHHSTNHCRDTGSGVRQPGPMLVTWVAFTLVTTLLLSTPPLKVVLGPNEML